MGLALTCLSKNLGETPKQKPLHYVTDYGFLVDSRKESHIFRFSLRFGQVSLMNEGSLRRSALHYVTGYGFLADRSKEVQNITDSTKMLLYRPELYPSALKSCCPSRMSG